MGFWCSEAGFAAYCVLFVTCRVHGSGLSSFGPDVGSSMGKNHLWPYLNSGVLYSLTSNKAAMLNNWIYFELILIDGAKSCDDHYYNTVNLILAFETEISED